MNWYLTVVRDNYFNFKSRARRKEYWMFYLFYILLSILTLLLDYLLGTKFVIDDQPIGGGYINTLFSICHIIPVSGVTVRRLHDTGKSGYWVLYPLAGYLLGAIGIITMNFNLIFGMIIIGISGIGLLVIFIMLLVFMFKDSHPGENKYGISPKYGMGDKSEDEN